MNIIKRVTFFTYTLRKRLLNHKRIENYVMIAILQFWPSTKAERFSLSVAEHMFTPSRANVNTYLDVLF